MNYLAHAYLSFSDGQLAGNMIADYLKNRDRAALPAEIQKGIRLHREIDTFTDAHTAVHAAKKLFSPLVRLYSGAFVDVSFDYFLAQKLAQNQKDFKNLSQNIYKKLWKNEAFLPGNFILVLEKMEKDDWLFNYQNDWGIDYSFRNVLNKAKYLDTGIPVFEVFLQNKSILKSHFDVFFPALEAHCRNFVTEL